MPAVRTARARARAEITVEIKQAARGQVARSGAAALSLRAVARELGFASSAIYRYFATRDDLLTALIVDAYVALAETLEDSGNIPGGTARARWMSTCTALRQWARQNPHEWALIYGSPVPGYQAPRQTVDPAARVFLAFARVVVEAPPRPGPEVSPGPALTDQLTTVAAMLDGPVPVWRILAMFQAISQLIGAVSMELFGHLVGSMDPADEFYAATVQRCADLLELD